MICRHMSAPLIKQLPPAAEALSIVGYADRFSAQPGDTVRVMVSAAVPFRAEVVRLVSAETARDGGGFLESAVAGIPLTEHPALRQPYRLGSFGQVSAHEALAVDSDFTVTAWIAPTTPARGRQTIVGTDAWRLAIDPDRGLVFAARDYEVASDVPVAAGRWSFIAASVGGDGDIRLVQRPAPTWPVEPCGAAVACRVHLSGGHTSASRLSFAARLIADGAVEHLNGRIEGPQLFAGALSADDLERLAADEPPDTIGVPLIAAWDFSLEIPTDRLIDIGPRGLHGRTVNLPTRAVTDHVWRGREQDWTRDAEGYGAIHFHDDDLEDAGWEPAMVVALPTDLRSGIYAAKLTSTGLGDAEEEYVPFFVRPAGGVATSPLLFLQSTNTHLAYANWNLLIDDEAAAQIGYPSPYPLGPEQRYAIGNRLLSLYDHHSDGSGVCYSSRLRPIVNMCPTMNDQPSEDGLGYPHGLKADLQLAGWLESQSLGYDVATDEDLQSDGLTLLTPYRTVLTGTHPEYWSEAMLDAAEAYLARGGRFVYLGGNGFYWVTSSDPARPHVIEVRRSNGTRTWSAHSGEYHHSTTGEIGGTWRERGRAPQRLAGVGFAGQGGGHGRAQPYRRTAAADDPRAAWIFEGVEAEVFGNEGLVKDGAAGFEIDRAATELGTPPHALVVATATGFSDAYQHAIEEVLLSDSRQGGTIEPRVRADMVFFETPNGGAVFSVGSIAYAGTLFARAGDGGEGATSRITGNVLRRFLDPKPFGT